MIFGLGHAWVTDPWVLNPWVLTHELLTDSFPLYSEISFSREGEGKNTLEGPTLRGMWTEEARAPSGFLVIVMMFRPFSA